MKKLGSTSLIALGALLLTLTAVEAQEHKTRESHGSAAMTLNQMMRKLWTDHVVWTRDYIVRQSATSPTRRLLQTG